MFGDNLFRHEYTMTLEGACFVREDLAQPRRPPYHDPSASRLGRHQPPTFSCLFCPLIFLALHPAHEKYGEAMAFWDERFSRWHEWVLAIRAALPPN